MGFRKRRGIKLPYEVQGQIYFTCKNYKRQPQATQRRILRLCEQAGGDNAEALFVYLTTFTPMQRILTEHHIASETTIYRAQQRFYQLWDAGQK